MGFYKEWHSAVSALAKDLRTSSSRQDASSQPVSRPQLAHLACGVVHQKHLSLLIHFLILLGELYEEMNSYFSLAQTLCLHWNKYEGFRR